VKLKAHTLEIIHNYTLYNKGPSDAKRTEIKLMWPMLPLSGFNEQTPLLYGIELPSIIRGSDPKANNDRCFIYQPVRYRIINSTFKKKHFFDLFRPAIIFLISIMKKFIIHLLVKFVQQYQIILFFLVTLLLIVFQNLLYLFVVMVHYVKVIFAISILFLLVIVF
jgi:hypothetical protein